VHWRLIGFISGVARDVRAVLGALPAVELGRRRLGPAALVERFRRKGIAGAKRSDAERLRLRKVIAAIDRCFPGGRNCYRRALLEMAVDPAAAAKQLRFGLRHGGGLRSGHAWLAGDPVSDRYDAEFSL
jgi:hypothetical protein